MTAAGRERCTGDSLTKVRWIYFVAPGSADATRAASDLETAPLSSTGRQEAELAGRSTEQIQVVVSSPARRAWQTAKSIAPSLPVHLDAGLREAARKVPIEAGSLPGRSRQPQAGCPGSSAAPFLEGERHAPLVQAMRRLERMDGWCVLVVADAAVIRRGVELLTGQTLPASCPRPSEVVLISRQPQEWQLGRRSSSPPALRSPIDRVGQSLALLPVPLGVDPRWDLRRHLQSSQAPVG